MLSDCAAELVDVFSGIYNMSLATSWVPACFKAAVIVPIPKQSKVTCLNDFRPVALTSIPDPYQFTYRENRSTEDAIAIVLHTLLEHLEQKNTYARLLFVDYCSAFNTIRPFKLRAK